MEATELAAVAALDETLGEEIEQVDYEAEIAAFVNRVDPEPEPVTIQRASVDVPFELSAFAEAAGIHRH